MILIARAANGSSSDDGFVISLPSKSVPLMSGMSVGAEDDFKGLIDLFEMDAYYYNDDKGEDIEIKEIPDDLKDLADEWHTNLVEKICDLDDDLMMIYSKQVLLHMRS